MRRRPPAQAQRGPSRSAQSCAPARWSRRVAQLQKSFGHPRNQPPNISIRNEQSSRRGLPSLHQAGLARAVFYFMQPRVSYMLFLVHQGSLGRVPGRVLVGMGSVIAMPRTIEVSRLCWHRANGVSTPCLGLRGRGSRPGLGGLQVIATGSINVELLALCASSRSWSCSACVAN